MVPLPVFPPQFQIELKPRVKPREEPNISLHGSFIGKPRREFCLLSSIPRLDGSRGCTLSFGGALFDWWRALDVGLSTLLPAECGLPRANGDTRFLDGLNMGGREWLPLMRFTANSASSERPLASRSFLDPSRTNCFISSYSPAMIRETIWASLSLVCRGKEIS